MCRNKTSANKVSASESPSSLSPSSSSGSSSGPCLNADWVEPSPTSDAATAAVPPSDAAPARVDPQTVEDMESDTDAFLDAAVELQAQQPMAASSDSVVHTAEQLWSHHKRNIHRVHEHFGIQALHNMASNLGSCTVISLYSGLGGAEVPVVVVWRGPEHGPNRVSDNPTPPLPQDPCRCPAQLAFMTNYIALREEAKVLGVQVPPKPRMLLACDFEEHCQRTLKQHQDRDRFTD